MERAWVLTEAACASGASPRTCGADSVLPCSAGERRNRGCRGADCGFLVTKQTVALLVPRMRHETVEVMQLVLVEGIKERVADQMVDIPVLTDQLLQEVS